MNIYCKIPLRNRKITKNHDEKLYVKVPFFWKLNSSRAKINTQKFDHARKLVKMSGEIDENSEGATKFFTEIFPPKLF